MLVADRKELVSGVETRKKEGTHTAPGPSDVVYPPFLSDSPSYGYVSSRSFESCVQWIHSTVVEYKLVFLDAQSSQPSLYDVLVRRLVIPRGNPLRIADEAGERDKEIRKRRYRDERARTILAYPLGGSSGEPAPPGLWGLPTMP